MSTASTNKKEEWFFIDKVKCPSDCLVIADAKEVFGSSEDLGQLHSKRTWEEYEEAMTKHTHALIGRIATDCLLVNRLDPHHPIVLDHMDHVLIYGRKNNTRLVELRILLDPLLDEFFKH